MKETDRAWLAGLVEGEGCFNAAKGLPRVTVKMTDEDVIRRAREVAGVGQVMGPHANGRKLPIWTWHVTKGHEAVAMMLFLYPYLGERRRAKISSIVEPWLDLEDYGPGAHGRQKTHCSHGHLYDAENTCWYVRADGGQGRSCRACSRDKARRQRVKKRMAAAA